MKKICALVLVVCAVASAAADEVKLTIAALRLGAPDLEASAAFYTQHLGFEMAIDARQVGFVALVNGDDWLVISQCEAPAEAPDSACHVRFNFATSDLEATAAPMREAGVQFTGEGTSAKGRYLTFVDPAGHRHNLMELDAEAVREAGGEAGAAEPAREGAAAGPAHPVRVYNASILVSDMPKARTFYEQTLGFAPASEKYHPPVVPYQAAGSTFFILSDREATTPAAAPAGADVAWAGLSLETGDMAQTKATLEQRGVRFEHEPQRSGPVLKVTFLDPFGNRMELIQHIRPEAPAPPQQPEETGASG